LLEGKCIAAPAFRRQFFRSPHIALKADKTPAPQQIVPSSMYGTAAKFWIFVEKSGLECRCGSECFRVLLPDSQSRENRMKRTRLGMPPIVTGLVILFTSLAMALAAAGNYRLIKKIPIPGDGGWDYVAADSEARRLYVSHDTEIVVLDLDSGAVIGKIAGGPDMHGAAIASEFGHGFISESNPGSVVIFDLKTLEKIGEVRVGDDPNGIIYDHETKRIFTADRGSKRITAIDAKTGKIAGTIENLGGRTEHLASDESGHIFLNMQDRNTLLKLDESDGNMAHRSVPSAEQYGYGSSPLAHFYRMPRCRHDGRGGRNNRQDRRNQPDWGRRRCGGI
jgi:hypothetical protein